MIASKINIDPRYNVRKLTSDLRSYDVKTITLSFNIVKILFSEHLS